MKVSNDPTIKTDTQKVFFIEATTMGNVKGYKQVDMSYTLNCGSEKVTLIDTDVIKITFNVGTQATFDIKYEDLMKNFTVDNADCGFTGSPEVFLNELEEAIPNQYERDIKSKDRVVRVTNPASV